MIQDNLKPNIVEAGDLYLLQVGKLSSTLYGSKQELVEKLDEGVNVYRRKHREPCAIVRMTNGRYVTHHI